MDRFRRDGVGIGDDYRFGDDMAATAGNGRRRVEIGDGDGRQTVQIVGECILDRSRSSLFSEIGLGCAIGNGRSAPI